MAKKATKTTKATKTAKAPAKRTTAVKAYSPHDSAIIQGGIVFIIVSAIAILSYVMSVYGVLK